MHVIAFLLATANKFTVLIVYLFFSVCYINRKHRFPFFSIVLFLASVISSDFSLSIQSILYFLVYNACFWSFLQSSADRFIKTLFYSISGLILLHSIIPAHEYYDLFDILNHKSYFACVLLMAFFSMKKYRKFELFVFLSALALSFSKIAIVVTIILSVYKFSRYTIALMISASVFLLLVFHVYNPDNLMDRVRVFTKIQIQALEQFTDRIYAPGHEGAFFRHSRKTGYKYKGDLIRHSHNAVTNIMAEKGLLGLILSILLVIEFLKYFRKCQRLTCRQFNLSYALVVTFIFNTIDFVFYNFIATVIFISFLALIDAEEKKICDSSQPLLLND